MGWFGNLGRERPWAQGCLIFASGLVLAVSGCFGFLLTLNLTASSTRTPQEILGLVGGGLFLLGCLATVVGFVWWIVGLVRVSSRSGPTVVPPPPPPNAGADGES